VVRHGELAAGHGDGVRGIWHAGKLGGKAGGREGGKAVDRHACPTLAAGELYVLSADGMAYRVVRSGS
jgi:hypothetical protein